MLDGLASLPLFFIRLTAAYPLVGVPVSVLAAWVVYKYVVPMLTGE
jgi:hypothetical protein